MDVSISYSSLVVDSVDVSALLLDDSFLVLGEDSESVVIKESVVEDVNN